MHAIDDDASDGCSLGLGPSNANADLNVNETSIYTTGTLLDLGAGALFASSISPSKV